MNPEIIIAELKVGTGFNTILLLNREEHKVGWSPSLFDAVKDLPELVNGNMEYFRDGFKVTICTKERP